MNKRVALLLALPASFLISAGLTHQFSQADSVSHLALLPGLPNLTSPVQPVFVPNVARPAAITVPVAPAHQPVAAPAAAKPKATTTEAAKTTASPSAKSATSTTTAKSKSKSKSKKNRKGRVAAKAAGTKAAAVKKEEEVKTVSLTFDDGPSPVYTPKVLAILKEAGIHATFCVIGREAKKHPELLRQIVADGNKIADHSMNHDEHLYERSDAKIKYEILSTKELIESIVPGFEVEYFRAPAGNINRHEKKLLKDWGLKPLGWSVDTKDWQKPGVDQILATVHRQLHSGGVVLMHDAGGNRADTIEALQSLIPQLKKEGYQFTFPGAPKILVSEAKAETNSESAGTVKPEAGIKTDCKAAPKTEPKVLNVAMNH